VSTALRRHWPVLLVLAAGAALRVVVMLAYDPYFWFTDTGRYLRGAAELRPDTIRPWGYSGFLWLTRHVLGLHGIVALQHALVLALAAAVYAFLVRRRVSPWLAALAAVPLALSPLVVNLEHHLLSDWLFACLLTAAALLLAWPDERPAVWACAVAGLAFAVAVVTREVGLSVAVAFLAYLVFRRAGWLRLGTFAVCLAVPVLAYLSWMHSTYGVFAFSTWSGKMLYARVAPFTDCAALGRLTAQEHELCDPRPRNRRPGPEGYLWTHGRGPQRRLPDGVLMAFARRVITHQPGAFLTMVAGQTGEVFAPGQVQRAGAACVAYWQYPDPLPGGCRTDAVGTRIWRKHPFRTSRPLAAGLHAYQRADWPVGPLMAACLLLTAAAVAWRPRFRLRRPRLDAAFLAVLGVGVTVAAVATATFSYRYTMPLYATVPPAAALAATQLAAARRSRT
jgi:4-amino-4-deoxy-L-arabinose transferase-like glycosyltransferase